MTRLQKLTIGFCVGSSLVGLVCVVIFKDLADRREKNTVDSRSHSVEDTQGRLKTQTDVSSQQLDIPMTLEQATQLAKLTINEHSEYQMLIKEVKVKDTGWIFYYDSKEAVESDNQQKDGVPGNVPLYIGTDGITKYLPNPNDPLLRQ